MADTDLRVGTIQSPAAAGRVAVKVAGSVITVPILRGIVAAAGDQALVLMQQRRAYVVGLLGTAATGSVAGSTVTPPPGDDPTALRPRSGSNVFKAVWAGSRRNGAWASGDLWQGDPNGGGLYQGAAFYGSGPFGLRGAICDRVRVSLTRFNGGSWATPTLRLLTESNVPAGAATMTASAPGPGLAPLNVASNIRVAVQTVWFDLPPTWGQALLDGSAGGVGIYVAAAAPAIQISRPDLAIDWTRYS